jgi:hypothetical protein
VPESRSQAGAPHTGAPHFASRFGEQIQRFIKNYFAPIDMGIAPRFQEENMIYELRVYHCMPGRLPALVRRFETVTVGLFEKYGIRQVGFWTVAIGESNQDFVYILQWESLADRDKRFAAFQADPEWIAARAKSEEGGPLVASITNTVLTPTKFSALK